MANNNQDNTNNNEEQNTGTTNNTGKRGFGSMDEEKQREIASRGGKAAHQKGTAHEFDSAEAKEAGRKGGEASHGPGSRPAIATDSAQGEPAGMIARRGAPWVIGHWP